jgi:glucose/arabinose dehydrogenase
MLSRSILSSRPVAASLALVAGAAGLPASAFAQASLSSDPRFTVSVFADGLDTPWGIAALPDGRFIVTERGGQVRLVDAEGRVSAPLGGVPAVAASGQGGLLDVVLDPAYASNRRIYLSYSEPGEGGVGVAVARAELAGDRLANVQVIWRQVPKLSGGRHFGSRLVFDRTGALFITLGDRGNENRVQDPTNTIGKVVRIRTDGTIPADNPAPGAAGAAAQIWSSGHRNIQGAAIDPRTGLLWTVEHGARGGDEINQPQPGRNYGWPVISYGVNYSGSRIGEGQVKAGYEQPRHYWDPSIAPSGMVFYGGSLFAGWRGDMIVGALAGQMLVRLDMDGDRVVGEERLLRDLGRRIRDVHEAADGALLLLIDSPDGQILRVTPRS